MTLEVPIKGFIQAGKGRVQIVGNSTILAEFWSARVKGSCEF